MKIQGESCGKAIGLWALAYELLVGNEMPLDSWLPRVKAAFPHPCDVPWMAMAPELGLTSGIWMVVTQAHCAGNAEFVKITRGSCSPLLF